LTWEADADARKRGAFAVRGLKISHVSKGINFDTQYPELTIKTETLSANFQPTIENNFATNEAKIYGG
jgi:hypothetical protein